MMTAFIYRITSLCPASMLAPMRAISGALGYGLQRVEATL